MNPSFHLRVQLPRADFSLDVDVRLPAHGITAVYGVSGSGKTSVLRAVAGLEPHARGRVALADQVWQDDAQGICLPTHQRAVGYVFQEASLFDHLDVQGNLNFGLHRCAGQQHALDAAIALLGIGALLKRRVQHLSGGERQRVAIARALATQPALLLLDEPLAALDAARRQDILPWLEKLRDELQLPMLYVTHAMDEVAGLADHLVLLEAGAVRAAGPLAELLARPDLPLARQDEAGVVINARVDQHDASYGLTRVAFDGGALWVGQTGAAPGDAVRARVLARDVSVARQRPQETSVLNVLPVVLETLQADGSTTVLRLRLGAAGPGSATPVWLLARITRRSADLLALQPGDALYAQVKGAALMH
jgi:molybdate transport system ATP-binding protein